VSLEWLQVWKLSTPAYLARLLHLALGSQPAANVQSLIEQLGVQIGGQLQVGVPKAGA
jgi:hypothetical protein